ncbi:MAG: hypothetical protein QM770_20400 [Tepidisphaeraceae bacterium]
MNYPGVVALAKSRGKTYTLGRHTMPGTPLFGMLDNPGKGAFNQPFGTVQKALTEYQWDALTLQPFDRLLDRHVDAKAEHESDLPTAIRYIDLAIQKSPDIQVYIYSRWPRRPTTDGKWDTHSWVPIDFTKLWNRPYTDNWDGTNESKDYFEKLTAKLNEHYAGKIKPIKIVPVGDVLAELDKRIKAGEVPGLSDINDLYRDAIHFKETGSYIVGLTFYSTLFHDDPRGLPTEPWGKLDPAQAKAIQEAVWSVVGKSTQ